MKKFKYLSFIALAFLITLSCEGPAGDDGEDGAPGIAGTNGVDGADGTNGTNGIDGTDGTPGVDGTASCLACHNLTVKEKVTTGYNLSTHGMSTIQWNGSTTVEYAGGRHQCAKCHSHEGFVETQHTGLDTAAYDFATPTNIQCGTCHDFHETLDFETDGSDFAMRNNAPVAMLTDKTNVIDLADNSNLCINCHQPRRLGPTADSVGNFTITSTHYGPHHGPQALTFTSQGAYLPTGETAYTTGTTTHNSQSSCVICHMDAADGEPADHDFKPAVETCTACHAGATDFDINGRLTTIEGLMTTLEGHLITAGLLDSAGHAVAPVTVGVDTAGAFFNYVLIEDDQSHGVHNPAYMTELLQASIRVFN